jgi:hypothetical protein
MKRKWQEGPSRRNWHGCSARSASRDVGCAWHQFQEPNALLDEEQSAEVFIRQCKMAAEGNEASNLELHEYGDFALRDKKG